MLPTRYWNEGCSVMLLLLTHTQMDIKRGSGCPHAVASLWMLLWYHIQDHSKGLLALEHRDRGLHYVLHAYYHTVPTNANPPSTSAAPMTLFTRTPTVCLFVRRYGDILEALRPALLLSLTAGQGARGTDAAAAGAATCPPAVPALLIAPFWEVVVVVMVLLLLLLLRRLLLFLLLLAYLGYVVVGVGVSGRAVEGIVAAVIPGLAEHVVGDLQTLVAGAGRFQEGQRLPPALRHLSLQGCCSDHPPLSPPPPAFLSLQPSTTDVQRARSHDLHYTLPLFFFRSEL